LLFSVVVATAVGVVPVPLGETLDILAQGMFHGSLAGEERAAAAIVYLIRFPRVLVAAMVGAALAVSGVLLQGLFRNPLAEAGIIGVSSGGALGAALAIGTGVSAGSALVLPCATFTGALAAAFAVQFMATRAGEAPVATLLLVGVAVNAVLASLTSLVLSLARDYEVSRQMFFWLMGGLDGRSWTHVQMIFPFVAVGFALSLLLSRDLDLMLLGEDAASSLGLSVARVRQAVLALAALMAGAAVAVSGTVGFVGLIVPHIVRLLVGPGHRLLVPTAALGGAIFVVWCDLGARSLLSPHELRLGIVTAVAGGPFFVHLLLREQRRWRGES
jgi:iron complex transport system permease protein